VIPGLSIPRTIEWVGGLDGHVSMIDQTRLPTELVMLRCRKVDQVWHAIERLSVRGAPAIGIAGAMGAVLGVRDYEGDDRAGFLRRLDETCDYLATSRPTAVNLFWALDRIRRCSEKLPDADVASLKQTLLEEARLVRDEDAAMCRAIGQVGEHLIPEGAGVLTHCNAGSLATAEYGTATAPMYAAHAKGRHFRVYADETRPLLQGARLTAWELSQAGIQVTVLCDNMAAGLMRTGMIDLILVGADRVAANGDVANKIGTYGLAVLAKAHNIPFYVAIPSSTFDPNTPDGSRIPIELRDDEEVRRCFGRTIVPDGVPCRNPAFDVTPADLVTGIVTEHGLIRPVDREHLAAVFCGDGPLPGH